MYNADTTSIQRRKPHADAYNIILLFRTFTESAARAYINIPRGVHVDLFLTNSLNVRDSYIVKTKAFSKRLYV